MQQRQRVSQHDPGDAEHAHAVEREEVVRVALRHHAPHAAQEREAQQDLRQRADPPPGPAA